MAMEKDMIMDDPRVDGTFDEDRINLSLVRIDDKYGNSDIKVLDIEVPKDFFISSTHHEELEEKHRFQLIYASEEDDEKYVHYVSPRVTTSFLFPRVS